MSGFTSFKTFPVKVMVVEDEMLTRTSLAQILSSTFSDVRFAEDGEEGLSLYDSFKPDIIFSDIVMPKMNGIEMLHEIKKKEGSPLIIIFSAFDTEVRQEDLDEIGVFRTMKKPFNLEKLEKLIADIREQLA
jgi:DNA-binding response OmpR family regulator